MDILINNPISHMYGPYFLWFYGAVILVTVTICKFVLQGKTFNSHSVKISDRPDPYELAYLRNGEKAVTKLVCFELIQKGYLQVKNGWIERASNTSASDLKPLEQTFFNWVLKPRTATDINSSITLKNAIAKHCQAYQKCLEDSHYLIAQKSRHLVAKVGVFIIVGLGSYKLISALSRGYHNVGFLIFMAIAATIWLMYAVYNSHNRLTRRGKLYLKNCQKTFSNLTVNTKSPPTEPDYNSSLLVALFDFDILRTNPNYQDFAKLFSRVTYFSKTSSKSSSSSGCGSYSSCGSSCGSSCSGGSCGGGCGGCGG